MKIKMLTIALLAGFLSLSAQAGFEQFGDAPNASINQYSLGGTWEQWMSWDLPNLISLTDDNRTFTLMPNISAYVNTPATYDNGSGDGTKKFDALTVFEHTLNSFDSTASMTVNVNSNMLDARYVLKIFLTVIDPSNGYQPDPTFGRIETTLTTTGTYTVQGNANGRGGMILQAGFSLYGQNAAPSNSWGSANITVTDLHVQSNDFTAPTPDPMTFVSAAPISDSAISVTATTATDDHYDVQYSFLNFTANTTSGWQSSPTWIDSGPSGGITTSQMTVANADFTVPATDWEIADGGGKPRSAAVLNGVLTTSVDGSAAGTAGSWALGLQQIDLSTTLFSEGDTINFSADIKTLPNLNGGGCILKIESWNTAVIGGATVEVPQTVTTNWVNYSMDYTIGAGATSIKLILGTATGWAGANAEDSVYIFDNVAVSGPVSTPAGLDPVTEYEYYVKARDTSVNTNTTDWSFAAYATTPATDYDPPTPATMSFVSTDVSPSTIKLTAVTASDVISSVQYYFECVEGPGNDSGWVDSPVYYDTGLAPGSNYSYTVIARDTSVSKWSNTVSAVKNLTTMSVESGGFTNTLAGFSGNTGDLDDLMTVEKSGLTTGSSNPDALIEFDTSGATFGDGLVFSGRDLLKTIATGYGTVSFEAYATLTFSGQTDLTGFIGMGQGLQTGTGSGDGANYGVPELNLSGANGMVAQFKDTTAGDIPNCQLFRMIDGNPADNGGTNIVSAPIGSTETIRAKLTYDALAETVTVAYMKAYTGGAFVADVPMGTLSTSLTDTNAVVYSMWDGAPVRVYVGGGEGTIVSDFEIVVTSAPHPEFEVQGTDIVAGEAVFTWDGTSGYTYDLQYKTNLVTDLTWMTDPSPGASGIYSTGGSISATSTVDAASVFYRIISQ